MGRRIIDTVLLLEEPQSQERSFTLEIAEKEGDLDVISRRGERDSTDRLDGSLRNALGTTMFLRT
jgi:hypothetical protein